MWQNSLGHCVLKADFPKGKKELAVSLFQVHFHPVFLSLLVCNHLILVIYIYFSNLFLLSECGFDVVQ